MGGMGRGEGVPDDSCTPAFSVIRTRLGDWVVGKDCVLFDAHAALLTIASLTRLDPTKPHPKCPTALVAEGAREQCAPDSGTQKATRPSPLRYHGLPCLSLV